VASRSAYPIFPLLSEVAQRSVWMNGVVVGTARLTEDACLAERDAMLVGAGTQAYKFMARENH